MESILRLSWTLLLSLSVLLVANTEVVTLNSSNKMFTTRDIRQYAILETTTTIIPVCDHKRRIFFIHSIVYFWYFILLILLLLPMLLVICIAFPFWHPKIRDIVFRFCSDIAAYIDADRCCFFFHFSRLVDDQILWAIIGGTAWADGTTNVRESDTVWYFR